MERYYLETQSRLHELEQRLRKDFRRKRGEKTFRLTIDALDLRLLGLTILTALLRFLIILTKDPQVSYALLFRDWEHGEHNDTDGMRALSYAEFTAHRARVRVFSFTGGVTIVFASMIVGLLLNLVTGAYQRALAATHTWSQTTWSTLTTNTTGEPAPANWTEYTATTTNLVAGTSLLLGMTVSSTTQTNDTDFNAGTNSSTAVSGTGTSSSVGLLLNSDPGTGGTGTASGSYMIRTFTSSGTFVLSSPLNVEYLVVAGGGGGGSFDGSGGGGAGGYLAGTLTSVNSGTYPITVGAGGLGGGGASSAGNGGNSVFSTITAVGGGYGGAGNAANGGSGGGGGGQGGPAGTAGIASPAGQGNDGAAGGSFLYGGGGGAGGVGGVAVSGGGVGGVGLVNSISGSAVTYATGGRGFSNNTVGPANTGNGGGGGSAHPRGGSGIVILKYSIGYPTSGTFTSSVIDTGLKQSFTTVSYSKTVPTNTAVTIDARAGNTATPDGTWTSWQTSIASGGSISGFGSNRYLQYRANLTTSDTSVTPTLNDITFNYTVYATAQSLTSSAFNSGSTANLMSTVSWTEDATMSSGAYAGVQLRTAASSGGLTSATAFEVSATSTGCSKSSTTVTCAGSAFPSTMHDGSNDQWYQYTIKLNSTGGGTPTISDITISYVVNNAPELQNVTASEQSDGTVLVSYQTRDSDTSTGTYTPGYITPSFEYSTNGGSSWTPITSNLSSGATSTKAVSDTTWNTYTATIDTKTLLNGTYSTQTQIRVTSNDGESASNTVSLATTNFTLDVKNPTAGAIPVLVRATSTPALLTFSATDDSTLSIRFGRLSDISDGSWQAYVATTTINLVSEPDTVYVQFRDNFLNTTSIYQVSTPQTPTQMVTRDVSNVSTTPNENRLFVSWSVVPAPGPGFAYYRVYRSTNGTTYALYTSISSRTTNYIVDDNSSAWLDANTTYYYKVLTEDTNGNTSYWSSVVSDRPNGQGGTDVTAPTITSVSAATTSQTATITWTTDELSNSTVGYCASPCSDYASSQGVGSYVTSHQVILIGLLPSTAYNYSVTSVDPSTNSASSTGYSFTTSAGPKISGTTVLSTNNTGAVITWNTDIPASGYVAYATNTPPLNGAEAIAGVVSLDTSRNITLAGLTSGATYFFYVKSQDGSGNWAYDENVLNGVKEYYTVRTLTDTTPPTISAVATSSIAANDIDISWQTNELASSAVQYGTTTGSYSTTVSGTTYDMTHYLHLSGLASTTLHFFRVISADQSGNSATSSEYQFTTTESQIPISRQPIVNNITVINEIVGGGGGGSIIVGVVQEKYDQLKADFDRKTEEFTKTLAELNDIKNNVLGIKEGDTITPEGMLKIVSEKFSSLSGIFSQNPSLSLNETDLNTAAKSLRDLAEAVPPPIILGKPEVVILPDKVTVSWDTDKETNSILALAADAAFTPSKENPYATEIGDSAVFTKTHEVVLTNLLPSTTYHYQLRSTTAIGTKTTTRDFTFKTPVQIPEIIDARLERVSDTSVRFTWTTNVLTNALVHYTPEKNGKPDPKRSATFGKPDFETTHVIVIDKLLPATTYQAEIISMDPEGTIARRDMATFTTGKDTTAPVVSQVRTELAVFPGAQVKIQAIIFWKTNELTTSQVFYESGLKAESRADTPTESTTQTTDMSLDHTVVLTNWQPDTVYRFRVVSVDMSGNMTTSDDFTVKTPQKKASIIDIISKNFSTTFSWTKNLGL